MNPFGYDDIKALTAETGRTIKDLLALAPGNDPFYADAPGRKRQAEWFAGLWQRLQPRHGTHVRRIHYQAISQDPKILSFDGGLYINTDRCWDQIVTASGAARCLEKVDPGAFTDRRNPDPISYVPETFEAFRMAVSGGTELELPDELELPSAWISVPTTKQRYHLEVWCEKSTMNDVLLPICRDYQAVLCTGVGEMSHTRLRELVLRAHQGGRPVRVFYVSDFDPAGQSMPVAAARKAEFWIHKLGVDVDLELRPIVLTAEQCRQYRLPRTPIKETEYRRHGFEKRYGEGATELDALEALHPGELRRIVCGKLDVFYDRTLSSKIHSTRNIYQGDLDAARADAIEVYSQDIAALDQELAHHRMQAEILNARFGAIHEKLQMHLEQRLPDEIAWPEAKVAQPDDSPLFDSKRGYLEQMEFYKEFQGKRASNEGGAE